MHALMQTLIMGLAALAGGLTNSYPALDVKAGIIPEVCTRKRACGDEVEGEQNTQVCLM